MNTDEFFFKSNIRSDRPVKNFVGYSFEWRFIAEKLKMLDMLWGLILFPINLQWILLKQNSHMPTFTWKRLVKAW